jgi:hypothetical protein
MSRRATPSAHASANGGILFESVLSCWNRIVPPLLCLIFAALSMWSLAGRDYSTGGLQLAFSAFWLLATFWNTRPAVVGRRHDG